MIDFASPDFPKCGRTQVISSRGSLFAGRAMYQRISDWNSSNVRQTTCLFPFAIVSERHSICASDRAERRSVVFISIHRALKPPRPSSRIRSVTPAVTPSAFIIAASVRLRAPPFGTANRSLPTAGYWSRNQPTHIRCMCDSTCRVIIKIGLVV